MPACFMASQASLAASHAPEVQHVPLLLTMPVLQQISEELLLAALLLEAVAVVLHKPVEMAQSGPV